MGSLCDIDCCAAIMLAQCVVCKKKLCVEHTCFYEVIRKLSGKGETTILLPFCPECADKLEQDTLISGYN